MGTTSTIAGHSSLTEILQAFPKNSERLLLLVSSIMEDPGDLSRGEREAIAAFVSGLNNTGYCVFYHAMFAEVLQALWRKPTKD